MPTFRNPQTRDFAECLTEDDSPLSVTARVLKPGVLGYEFSLPEWEFLNDVLASPAELEPATATEQQARFWRKTLECDELEFVRLEGSSEVFPREILDDWPDNAGYHYEIWQRERRSYKLWLDQVSGLEKSLSEPVDWSEEVPEAGLRSLEFELAHTLPDRVALLKRLYLLGLLAEEDQDYRHSQLVELGCERLVRWRQAALTHRWVSRFLEGMWPEGAGSALSSPVGLEWFLDGPPMQKHLDPLTHLKFALHHHLKRDPPNCSSSFVVSMGGRISGAFYYQLGPGGIAQLVRGGEPPLDSPLRPLYRHAKSDGGNRAAELAGRAIRQGLAGWGGLLALAWLSYEPTQGQCWVELGVALAHSGHTELGKGCLLKAQELGHDFHTGGELSELWAHPCDTVAASVEPELLDWQSDLAKLSLEELTALVLCREVCSLPLVQAALSKRELPPALRRLL